MATTSHKPHPLIGKLIMIDNGDDHCTSRFIAEIGPGLMLARRVNPRTGEDFVESHIIVLAQVAQGEMTLIFDHWNAYRRWYDCSDGEKRVIKLVPKDER